MSLESNNVADWVDYIQTLHAREIELSLERVREVFHRLCPSGVPFTVISVAGTNGKGSTTEILQSIYRSAGYKAGKFTSPHLVRFNERFNVDGVDVDDGALLAEFQAVERARGTTPITYFEYGLLLAIEVFISAKVDIAILEVGLGGRLDAVNILDADVAVITSIALDHTDWLGDTLEQIAFEKAGIARANTPCVIGLREPQVSMSQHLKSIQAIAHIVGHDFECSESASGWRYRSDRWELSELPAPFGQQGVQLVNASLAIRCVECLNSELMVDEAAVRAGLEHAQLAARCQILRHAPLVVLDVAHNEASVNRLANFLESLTFSGRLIVACGFLKDKEIAASLDCLAEVADEWHLASINAERGAQAEYLKACLGNVSSELRSDVVNLYEDIETAYNSAFDTLTVDDCLVVFGSFYVAGDIICALR